MCSTKWTVIARLAARRTQTRLPGRTFAASPALARWGRRRARACDASVARRTRRGSVHHYDLKAHELLSSAKLPNARSPAGPRYIGMRPPNAGGHRCGACVSAYRHYAGRGHLRGLCAERGTRDAHLPFPYGLRAQARRAALGERDAQRRGAAISSQRRRTRQGEGVDGGRWWGKAWQPQTGKAVCIGSCVARRLRVSARA